jgi:hypothetical protein
MGNQRRTYSKSDTLGGAFRYMVSETILYWRQCIAIRLARLAKRIEPKDATRQTTKP